MVISGLVVASAIYALEAHELVYGAVGLAISLIGVAGLFVLLGADYLAIFQVAVYVGAVVVLIMFTIMLVRRERGEPLEVEEPIRLGRAGIYVAVMVALAVAAAMVLIVPVSVEAPEFYRPPIRELASSLSASHAVALVVLGFLIVATVVGGLTLAKVEREERSGGAA